MNIDPHVPVLGEKRLAGVDADPNLSERLEPLETVETEQGAHTSGWDPVDRSLYVFCPASGGAAVYEERG